MSFLHFICTDDIPSFFGYPLHHLYSVNSDGFQLFTLPHGLTWSECFEQAPKVDDRRRTYTVDDTTYYSCFGVVKSRKKLIKYIKNRPLYLSNRLNVWFTADGQYLYINLANATHGNKYVTYEEAELIAQSAMGVYDSKHCRVVSRKQPRSRTTTTWDFEFNQVRFNEIVGNITNLDLTPYLNVFKISI